MPFPLSSMSNFVFQVGQLCRNHKALFGTTVSVGIIGYFFYKHRFYLGQKPLVCNNSNNSKPVEIPVQYQDKIAKIKRECLREINNGVELGQRVFYEENLTVSIVHDRRMNGFQLRIHEKNGFCVCDEFVTGSNQKSNSNMLDVHDENIITVIKNKYIKEYRGISRNTLTVQQICENLKGLEYKINYNSMNRGFDLTCFKNGQCIHHEFVVTTK